LPTEATYPSKITTHVSCILQIQTKFNYSANIWPALMVNYQKHCTGLPLHTLKKKKKVHTSILSRSLPLVENFLSSWQDLFHIYKMWENKTSLPPDEAHFSSGHPNFCLAWPNQMQQCDLVPQSSRSTILFIIPRMITSSSQPARQKALLHPCFSTTSTPKKRSKLKAMVELQNKWWCLIQKIPPHMLPTIAKQSP